MSFFLAALGIGLGGLLLMAIPGMRRHGHAGHARTRAHVRTHARARGQAHARGAAQAKSGAQAAPAHAGHVVAKQGPNHGLADGLLHYLPEPRAIFSVLALLGAFGNAALQLLHLPFAIAAVGAAAAAVVVEWAIVGRLWRLALRFTGEPASPLATLVMDQAEAVTAFRNGKGIVRAVLDGRAVQLSAELVADERALTVRVGDRVTIQEVDPDREHVRVSLR
jgi:hypothetical protein